MSGLLAGLRVLDLTRVLAGPYCTMILADLGAEVVKVERPGRGDHARDNGPFFEGPGGGVSSYFASLNRGKRSITLDLGREEGRTLFLRLARRADVVVENFRAGAMERLGLGYGVLARSNPRLIYAACSGFGQEGPYAHRPAYDVIIQAMAGTMSINGTPAGPPTRVGFSIGDIGAALYMTVGILAALQERERTGRGRRLDVSMLDCQLALLENAFARHFASGEVPRRLGSRHPVRTPFQTFPTRDGAVAVAVGTEAHWHALCRALDRPDLADDPRFAANAERTRYRAELEAELEQVFRTRSASAWLEALEAAGVPAGPVRSVDQVAADPHVRARGVITEVADPRAGMLRLVDHPVRYRGAGGGDARGADPDAAADAGARGPAPRLGEHGAEVLGRWLGVSAAEIDALSRQGVL